MSTAEKITTADELFHLTKDGYRCELWRGELKEMSPTGSDHGFVVGNLSAILGHYILKNKLGRIAGAETGFLIEQNPDSVLAPDVAFVRQERIEAIGRPRVFYPEAPALAAEVASPGDTIEEVDTKMRRWLTAGAELAWVVNPRGRTVTIYRALNDIQVLTEQDTLTGESVVPGFECQVSELFDGLQK